MTYKTFPKQVLMNGRSKESETKSGACNGSGRVTGCTSWRSGHYHQVCDPSRRTMQVLPAVLMTNERPDSLHVLRMNADLCQRRLTSWKQAKFLKLADRADECLSEYNRHRIVPIENRGCMKNIEISVLQNWLIKYLDVWMDETWLTCYQNGPVRGLIGCDMWLSSFVQEVGVWGYFMVETIVSR